MVVYLSSVCNVVKTVTVPVGLPVSEHVVSSDLSNDLRLSWESPQCGRCESHGGRCGFDSNTSQVVCSHDVSSKGTTISTFNSLHTPSTFIQSLPKFEYQTIHFDFPRLFLIPFLRVTGL